MTYGSVCSGIEAATVAWHPLGWRPAWFAEIDPFCSALLNHHYPEVRNRGDFTAIGADAGPVDVLVGGTPCQAFSVAGKRGGLDDPRGNLTLEYLRLAGRLRPRWLVWENVPGVLSIDGGRTFGAILGALGQLGYGFAYRVLDAQFFGVPQRRRRVFVVGRLGDWRRAAAVLLEREGLCRDTPARRKTRQNVAALTADGVGTCGADDNQAQAGHILAFGGNNTAGPIDVASAVNAHGGSGRMDFESETFISHALLAKPNCSYDHALETYLAHALRADGFDASEDGTGRGTPLVPVPILEAGARTGKSTTDPRAGLGIGDPGDPMFTLQAGKQHAIAFSCKDYGADASEIAPTLRAMPHNRSHQNAGGQVAIQVITPAMAVRRLTPRECERLQGFPDDYTLIDVRKHKKGCAIYNEPDEPCDCGAPYKPAADGPRYKAIGNSMAVPVMRWIGERIQAVDSL